MPTIQPCAPRPADRPRPRLDDVQRDLLERMRAGQPVVDAAAAIFVSRRTAWRRLQAARRAFGVATNAELIDAYERWRAERPPSAGA